MNAPRFSILVVLFVLSLFASPAALAAGLHVQKQVVISAASTVLSQSGVIGGYSFPDPGVCSHSTNSPNSLVGILGQPKASAKAGQSLQKVGVVLKVYQRLANGSLGVPFNTAEFSQTVGSSLSNVSKQSIAAPLGGDYVFAYEFRWYASNGSTVEGRVEVALTSYQNYLNGVLVIAPNTPNCSSPWPEWLDANPATGTVNSKLYYQLGRYPRLIDVPITWDGLTIGSATTDVEGASVGSVKIPAAPIGPHIVRWKYGHWDTQTTFTVKPRIKIIPNLTQRGATVNVSLRGYAAGETVRIRWKKGSSWVQLATVTTSGSGSANIDVKVPKWIPDGLTSVRGDGQVGRAQTNAVSVFGGPFSTSSARVASPTPSPTNTPQVTASPSPTASATQTPVATASPESTTPAATLEASPTSTPTEMPVTETPSPEATATATAVVETPTSDVTVDPDGSPEATATTDLP